jgi:putrescine aminotransferase
MSGAEAAHMADRDALLRLYGRHVNAGMERVFRLAGAPMEARAVSSVVYDDHGTPYLDCGGYGVFLLGHCHPDVVDAVMSAVTRHPMTTRLLFDGAVAEAAHALAALAPAGLRYVWFANSGAEAVEAAIKLCRLNGCDHVVATDRGFHGKTLGALSVSGHQHYRDPFEPLLDNVTRVVFGDAGAVARQLERLEQRAAVIVEPVQSEGGVRVPQPGYLRDLRDTCDRYDALLVVDEISTGLGRLGTWWAVDTEDVHPDILLTGKALGGGVMPVSAAIARPDVFAPLNRDPMLHTSTFAGSPVAAAAVSATIRVARDLDIPSRASTVGERLLTGITEVVAATPSAPIVDVRGTGLLLGIECAEQHHAAELVLELLANHVVVSHSLHDHRVVRLTPPAVLTGDEQQWVIDAVDRAVTAVGRRWSDQHARSSIGGTG